VTPPPSVDEPYVVPLRKVASAVPSAITLGRGNAKRTSSSPDAFVSKVPRLFARHRRPLGAGRRGARAQRRLGSAAKRLDAHGAPSGVQSGDLLTFGRVVFLFLDAADLWDRPATSAPSRVWTAAASLTRGSPPPPRGAWIAISRSSPVATLA